MYLPVGSNLKVKRRVEANTLPVVHYCNPPVGSFTHSRAGRLCVTGYVASHTDTHLHANTLPEEPSPAPETILSNASISYEPFMSGNTADLPPHPVPSSPRPSSSLVKCRSFLQQKDGPVAAGGRAGLHPIRFCFCFLGGFLQLKRRENPCKRLR